MTPAAESLFSGACTSSAPIRAFAAPGSAGAYGWCETERIRVSSCSKLEA